MSSQLFTARKTWILFGKFISTAVIFQTCQSFPRFIMPTHWLIIFTQKFYFANIFSYNRRRPVLSAAHSVSRVSQAWDICRQRRLIDNPPAPVWCLGSTLARARDYYRARIYVYNWLTVSGALSEYRLDIQFGFWMISRRSSIMYIYVSPRLLSTFIRCAMWTN